MNAVIVLVAILWLLAFAAVLDVIFAEHDASLRFLERILPEASEEDWLP